MKTTLDILQIAVIVVYIVMVVYFVMVVYILWTNNRLTKLVMKLEDDNRTNGECVLKSYDKYERLMKDDLELLNEYRELKRDHDKLKSNYVETRKNCEMTYKEEYELKKANDELRAKYDELLGEKEELKRKYDLLYAESTTLEYVNGRIKEIAEAQCPSIASLYKRMMLMREQNIKRIMNPEAHIEELLKNMPCAHDAEPTDFTTAFESAAQESSKEDWNKSVKKAKAEEEQ